MKGKTERWLQKEVDVGLVLECADQVVDVAERGVDARNRLGEVLQGFSLVLEVLHLLGIIEVGFLDGLDNCYVTLQTTSLSLSLARWMTVVS